MRRLAPPLSLVALTLALFGAWMHWAVLLPGNVGWLLAGDDRGQSAIGLAAYLRAGHWPSLHEPLLVAPEGAGLLFTDSIPLLGLLLGPVAALLPPSLQFIGPWLLACMALQVGFAWLLVRPHAADGLAALLGTALLAGMPVLFNRYGHASLCAQWLLLWALWIFVDPERSRRWGWWTAALAVAALIHSYLLLMVAAFWGGAVLALACRPGERRAALAVALVPPLPAVAIMAWYGVFAGSYASTGTYGAFPFALDAFWNTANPGYGALLPASADRGHGYEGFAYLGAGLLALVALLIVRAVAARRHSGSRLAWLLPGFALVLLIAIGPQPTWCGEPLMTLRLSAGLIDALDPVRAAGRLVWPMTYTLAYAAIVGALRMRRATLVLGVALALQVIDLAPMLAAVRATSARADDPRLYRRTPSPRWTTLVAAADQIEFEPADPFIDLQLMEEVSWRAVASCRPLRSSYTARERRDVGLRIAADAAAFAAGRLDPRRLYVLLDGDVPPAVAARVERVDGIAIIAPRADPAPPGCISPSSSRRSAS